MRASSAPLTPNVPSANEPARWSIAWIVRRVFTEPGKILPVAIALLRGHWCRAWYRLRGVRLHAGPRLRIYGRLKIYGPGEVILGEDVCVLERAVLRTHAPDARIVIGDRTFIGATEFGCMREIVVGRDCLLARAAILDTDHHSTRADRRNPEAPVRVAPVYIADNAWIGQSAGILPGTRIGRNSVVAFGAVCVREYPDNVIIMGNPAKVVAPIPGGGAVGGGAVMVR